MSPTNLGRLPRRHAPKAHLQQLYIDKESLLQGNVATVDEINLIRLGFGVVYDASIAELDCRCGSRIFDRLGPNWTDRIGHHGPHHHH